MLVISCCIFLIVLISAFLIGTAICMIPAAIAVLLCGNSIEKKKVPGGLEVTKAVDSIDYLLHGIIKSHTPTNINFNPDNITKTVEIVNEHNEQWHEFIIQIFKDENEPYHFMNELDYSNKKVFLESDKKIIKSDKKIIKKYTSVRELVNNYPISDHVKFHTYFGDEITELVFEEENPEEYNKILKYMMKMVFKIYIRGKLTEEEEAKANKIVDDFASGKYVTKNITIKFANKPDKIVKSCNINNVKNKYNGVYKKLHWGQRKLMMSEIDFFNRVAQDMGAEKFKHQVISVCYPGSAHGNHLMILMELYPNITFYLWDPARYNNVLYLIEFMRRKLPINWSYKPYERVIAEKYEGRVFINMNLNDDEFVQYHFNASKSNFSANHTKNWGLFTDSSIEYFHDFRTAANDTSPLLIISDIRLYAYHKILGFFPYNFINLTNIKAMNYVNDKMALSDYNRDMKLQEDWFLKTKSSYGLLKFKLKSTRLFTVNLQKKYLDGEILLQAWAPVVSTETRLFVKPKRELLAYYNIYGYEKSLRFFNAEMRTNDMRKVKLSELKIKVVETGITIGDIWEQFLPSDKIGMDAVLETYMLYDYLKLYKDPKLIKSTDIMLMISDITQTLLSMTNHQKILGYFDDQSNPKRILEYRNKTHKKFNDRLDYNSMRGDNYICQIQSD
jgi:hypothetical protein